MKTKLLAFDLDGTTIDSVGKISDDNINAITKAKENGIVTVVSTGRTFFEIPKVIRNHPDVDYFIYSDGAGIKKTNGIQFKRNFLSYEMSKQVFDIFNKYDTMIEFYENGNPYTETKNMIEKTMDYYSVSPHYQPVIRKTRIGLEDYDSYFKKHHELELVNVFFRDLDERTKCKKEFDKISDKIICSTSMKNNLEVTNINASKGQALAQIAKEIEIAKSDIVAIGDSENDLSMAESCDTFVAVDNACEKVKALASYSVCSNNYSAIKFLVEILTK